MKTKTEHEIRQRIKWGIILFIVLLCLSGITAFPLETEIMLLHRLPWYLSLPFLTEWIDKVYQGIKNTEDAYPFMAYGTDWLAFSHLVISVAFFGPLKDPIKNIWVIQFGRIACIMVFPLAFICGGIRGIPVWWQFIDCSFGVGGFALLTYILHYIKILDLNTNLKNQTL
jgi:hypothetical protein